MKQFHLSASAQRDLRAIRDYIAERSGPNRAARVIERFVRALRRLAEHPGLGRARPDLAPESTRFFPVYSYLIVYDATSAPLRVLRVIHGARDLRSALGDE